MDTDKDGVISLDEFVFYCNSNTSVLNGLTVLP